jgi:hypothetical protein
MITVTGTHNERKLSQVEAELAELLKEILRRGFYGTAGVEVSVQDGVIQHVRSRMEKIVR